MLSAPLLVTRSKQRKSLAEWIQYSTVIYTSQAMYLLAINFNSMYIWWFLIISHFFFGMIINHMGDDGAKRQSLWTLTCFSRMQLMIVVCNTFYIMTIICTLVTLHVVHCSNCLQTFESGSETCLVVVQNHTKFTLTKLWCSEWPLGYIIRMFLIGANIHISFMAATAARKLGEKIFNENLEKKSSIYSKM